MRSNPTGQGKKSFLSRGDIILIVVIVLGPAFLLYTKKSPHSSPGKKIAEISVNSKVTEIISLNSTGRKLLPCEDGDVEIEYGDGRIRVVRSTCPRQICVKTGWISNGDEIILCVPNRLLIRIVEAGSRTPDGVTF